MKIGDTVETVIGDVPHFFEGQRGVIDNMTVFRTSNTHGRVRVRFAEGSTPIWLWQDEVKLIEEKKDV